MVRVDGCVFSSEMYARAGVGKELVQILKKAS